MKKKKNSILIIALAVVLVAVCALVAYLAIGMKDDEPTTKQAETTVSQTTTAVLTTAVQTTQTTTETTTAISETSSLAQTQASDPYPFIRQGCWYLADGDRDVCYAFVFHKNGSADVAYFNSENIEGFDAQYSKGTAKYVINGNIIVFAKLPSTMDIKKIELEIKGNSIEYKGDKLKKFKKISLDNALKCF